MLHDTTGHPFYHQSPLLGTQVYPPSFLPKTSLQSVNTWVAVYPSADTLTPFLHPTLCTQQGNTITSSNSGNQMRGNCSKSSGKHLLQGLQNTQTSVDAPFATGQGPILTQDFALYFSSISGMQQAAYLTKTDFFETMSGLKLMALIQPSRARKHQTSSPVPPSLLELETE